MNRPVWKIPVFWIVWCGVLGLLTLFFFGLSTNPKQVPSPLIGKSAPDFVVQELSGVRKLQLSQLQSSVVLNFWASWCPPCLAEMPNINQLYQDYADNDEVVFLMISVEDNFEKSKALVKRKGFDFQIYHVESLNLPAIYKGTLPTTFLLSKDGKVLMQHEGMANYDNEQTRTLIKKALDD